MAHQPLQYQYKVPYAQRGRECNFTTISLDLFDGVPPDPELRKQFVQRPFYDSEISNVPVLSCASTNTERKEVESRGQRHKEGGWPLTVDCEEVLDVGNYNKRAEREEGYLVAAQKLMATMERNLRLNCAVDIYGTYYTSKEDVAAAGTTNFSDPKATAGQRAKEAAASGGGRSFHQAPAADSDGVSAAGAGNSNVNHSYRDPDTIAKLCCVAKLAVHDARRPADLTEADQLAMSNPNELTQGGGGGSGASLPPPPMVQIASSVALNLEPTTSGGIPQGFMAVQSSWTCGSESTRLAVAYSWDVSPANLNACTGGGGNADLAAAALWNIHNPSAPEMLLFSPFTHKGGASCVSCSSKDSHVIAGGSHLGVVQYWDSRQGGKGPVGHSDPRHSHRGPVTDIKYLLSKGLECFSVGRDGRVLFWDLRNLSKPTEADSVDLGDCLEGRGGLAGVIGGGANLTPSASTAVHSPLKALGGAGAAKPRPSGAGFAAGSSTVVTASCVDYDPMVGGAHKYTVGTAEGNILCCSRRGRTPQEKITSTYAAHHGKIFDVCRNPANPKYFATIGDWGFRIFGDELKNPICGSPCGVTHATCGRWHPTRPTVLCVGTANGSLEFWDLMHSLRTPAMRLALTSGASDPLTSIVPHPAGENLAVCSRTGSVYLTQLPPILYSPQQGERQRLIQSFDDEYGRVRTQQHQQRLLSQSSNQLGHSQRRPSNVGGLANSTMERSGLGGAPVEPEYAFGAANPELAAQLRMLGETYLAEAKPARSPSTSPSPARGGKAAGVTSQAKSGASSVQFTPRPPSAQQ